MKDEVPSPQAEPEAGDKRPTEPDLAPTEQAPAESPPETQSPEGASAAPSPPVPISDREQRLLAHAHALAGKVDTFNARLAEAGYGANRDDLLNARDALRYEIEQSYPDWTPSADEPLPEPAV